MMVFFSSVDCSGKNTLMHSLSKLYNYKYFMAPRSPICNIVYDKIHKRKGNEPYNFRLIKSFLEEGAYFVFVNVDPKILEDRALSRNEKHVNNIEDFKYHLKVYKQVFEICKKYFKEYKNRFVKIENTNDITIVSKKLKNILDDFETGA